MHDSVSSVWPNSQFSTVTWGRIEDYKVEMDADGDKDDEMEDGGKPG